MKTQLVFVYNAYNGMFNSVIDFAHKIISPSTYQCNLCALTYSNFLMKNEWRTFIQQLPADVLFLHKDEFEKKYKAHVDLPAAFIVQQELKKQILFQSEIDNCKTLVELKSLIIQKLKENMVLTDNTENHE